MRILFWNIMHGGGSRAGAIVEQILEWNPDVVALAEFRGTAPSQSIARALADAGLKYQLSKVDVKHRAWNAVFLASRFKLNTGTLSPPEAPYAGLYWLPARVETQRPIEILVTHVPYSYKYGRWKYYEMILHITTNWQLGRAVVIGDMNTGITGLDEETADSEQYKDRFVHPFEALGWRDMFRVYQPDADAPTWYSRSGNGRRLDQAFVNAALQPYVAGCFYDWGDSEKRGKLSGHAAILLDIDMPS